MSYEVGKVTNVWIANLGSELIVDAAAAQSSLIIDDAFDFNPDGGTLRLTSDSAQMQLTYASADIENDIITMSAPLAALWPAGTTVDVVPLGWQKKAMVDLDDQDEGVVAVCGQFDPVLDDGIRDEVDQEAVFVSDDSGRWEIVAIDDEIMEVLGSQVSGVGLPVATPDAAPATTPPIKVSGNATSLVIESDPIEVGNTLKVYISDVEGFTPSPANLYANTQATIIVANTLPGGGPLQNETAYYVQTFQSNALGDAAIGSGEVSDTLHPEVLSQYVMSVLVAGYILTGKIQVGQAYIDADEGIVIPQPDGGSIRFPVNGDYAQITAHLIARSLNVTDNLTINGANNQIFGSMTVGEGIVKPQTGPLLSGATKPLRLYTEFTGTDSLVFQGAITDPWPGATRWMTPIAFFGVGCRLTGKNSGTYAGDITISGIPAAIDDFQPFGSMIYAPDVDRYVMLGTATDATTGVRWYYVLFNRTSEFTLTYVARLDITAQSTFPYQTRMAYDAISNNYWQFYYNNTDDRLRAIRFYPTATAITRDSGVIVSPLDIPSAKNIGGVYIGNADFGAKRYCIPNKNGKQYVFTGSPGSANMALSPNDEWAKPASSIMSLDWDGTRFWEYDAGGNIYKLSTNKAPAGRATVPIQGRHTWYDGAGTTHETDGGPITSINLPARQWLRAETSPAPDTDGNPGDPDKADQIRIYLSNDGTTTPRLQTAYGWEAMVPPENWRPKTRNMITNVWVGETRLESSPKVMEKFTADDIGAVVTGTGIDTDTTIVGIDTNGTEAVLSKPALSSSFSATRTITPTIDTRSGLFESIVNTNAAPPATNGFISVGRAPGDIKSARTDALGNLWKLSGDGSGRIGPINWDNTSKMGDGLFGMTEYTSTSTATVSDATFEFVPSFSTVAGGDGLTSSFSSGQCNVLKAGLYIVIFSAQFATNLTGRRISRLRINTVEVARTDYGSGGPAKMLLVWAGHLSVGDVVLQEVWQNSGAGLALAATPVHTIKFVKIGPV